NRAAHGRSQGGLHSNRETWAAQKRRSSGRLSGVGRRRHSRRPRDRSGGGEENSQNQKRGRAIQRRGKEIEESGGCGRNIGLCPVRQADILSAFLCWLSAECNSARRTEWKVCVPFCGNEYFIRLSSSS